jgi:hypothetical protein
LAARDHALGHRLRDEEGAARVGVHHVVVVLGRDVDQPLRRADARVVDQDVDGAHLGLGMRHRGGDAVGVGDVERHHMGVAALGLDLGAQRLQPLHAARGQHHAGAGLGQRARELRAQAAGGAGDQRHAAGRGRCRNPWSVPL